MKKNFLISLLFLSQLGTFGQELSINILPRYSFGATTPSSYQVVQGQSFVTTILKTTYSGTLVKPDGTTVQYDESSHGLGLDVLFNRSNEQNGNAWGVRFISS